MIVEMMDGSRVTMHWRTACTGIIATQITITAEDAHSMAQYMARDPADFEVCMRQLLHRFPINRAGGQ